MTASRTNAAKKGGSNTALARVGDPLIAEGGRRIDPEGYVNGKPLPTERPQLELEAATFRAQKKRTLGDLPSDVNMINGVAAVFMYTMLGVGDREIADALRITVPEVDAVRKHSAFNECFQMVIAEVINKNSDLLTARIAAYSHSALDVVGSIAIDGKK